MVAPTRGGDQEVVAERRDQPEGAHGRERHGQKDDDRLHGAPRELKNRSKKMMTSVAGPRWLLSPWHARGSDIDPAHSSR